MKHSALRDAYDMIQFVKENSKEFPITRDSATAEFIRKYRREIRRINRYKVDPLAQTLTEEWRHLFDEDGEGGYDFGILADDGETIEEIREMAEASLAYPEICSPYDCTGKRFTAWIAVRRVPMGFAVIHRWGLDV